MGFSAESATLSDPRLCKGGGGVGATHFAEARSGMTRSGFFLYVSQWLYPDSRDQKNGKALDEIVTS